MSRYNSIEHSNLEELESENIEDTKEPENYANSDVFMHLKQTEAEELAKSDAVANTQAESEQRARLEAEKKAEAEETAILKPNFVLQGNPLQEIVASKPKENERLVKEEIESTTPNFKNFTKGFGSKMLEKYGWVKGTAISNTPDAIIAPLFELKGSFDGKSVTILRRIQSPRDERRFRLINELESLLSDDYKEDKNKNKPIFLPSNLEYFHPGSFEAPLVRDTRFMSISDFVKKPNKIKTRPKKNSRSTAT